MTRNFEVWLKQMERELRWLPGTRRGEIIAELRVDLAQAAELPDPPQLASEILSTELKMSPAGYGRRAAAFILDFLLTVAITVIFMLPLPLIPNPLSWWWLVIPLVLTAVGTVILWFPFFEAITGQTPGKKLLGLAVVSEDGRPCTWGQAWIRRIPYLVQALFIIDAIFIFFQPQGQRAFDKVARTLVINDPRGGDR